MTKTSALKILSALTIASTLVGFSATSLAQTSELDNSQAGMNQSPDSSQVEVQCAPFVHAQGAFMQVKIIRATEEAQVTMGAPSFNRPTTTESYPVVQKISDTHGRTVNYQTNNFALTLDQNTSTATLHVMFQGEEKLIENLVCRN